MKSFSSLTEDNIAAAISEARERVIMGAPGVTAQIAKALAARSGDISVIESYVHHELTRTFTLVNSIIGETKLECFSKMCPM